MDKPIYKRATVTSSGSRDMLPLHTMSVPAAGHEHLMHLNRAPSNSHISTDSGHHIDITALSSSPPLTPLKKQQGLGSNGYGRPGSPGFSTKRKGAMVVTLGLVGVLLVTLLVTMGHSNLLNLMESSGKHSSSAHLQHMPGRPGQQGAPTASATNRGQQEQQPKLGSASELAATHSELRGGSAPGGAVAQHGTSSFDAADAAIQQYTLWGPLGIANTTVGAAVHIWVRTLCSQQHMVVRGFAMAEPTAEAPPFYIEHPKLADEIAAELPQLQLQLLNGTWVPAQQVHVGYIDGSYPNVWHWEVVLPAAAALPHLIGVRGWDHMTDLRWNRAGCSSPVAASQQLPWRSPGSVWFVVSPADSLPVDLHAFVIIQNLRHHQQLGLAGLIVVVDSWDRMEALASNHSSVQQAVEDGHLFFWVWAGYRYARKPYYAQTHVYNAVLLAAWGAGVHLLVADLDEWMVVPSGKSLPQLLAPGGCLHGISQAKIKRFDHIHPIWHNGTQGDVHHWLRASNSTSPTPTCHRWLADYQNIGPQPYNLNHKSLVNPDHVVLFHSHHGLVLGPEWASTNATLLAPNTTAAAGVQQSHNRTASSNSTTPPPPAGEVATEDVKCVYFMHFINLFHVRRHLEEVPREERKSSWRDVKWQVNACLAEAAARAHS